MSYYPGADRSAQWFQDDYPGSSLRPNVVVIHTTEGGSWPGYSDGSTAPNLTIMADKRRQKLVIRQHFPLDRSSRALRNERGGVETNTCNAIQIELIGSCDREDGYGAIYWPNAPEWCYVELGKVLATLHGIYPAIRLVGPDMWLAYGRDDRRPGVRPASYGAASPARMTFAQWRNFTGVCGHQHVPENVHGDPGDMPMAKVLQYARGGTTPANARPNTPDTTQEDEVTPKDIDAIAAKVADKVLSTRISPQDDAPKGRYVSAILGNLHNGMLRIEGKIDQLLEKVAAPKE